MNRSFASLFLCCAICLDASLATSAALITIDTLPVGDVGNGNDPSTGSLYGGVGYAYRIGAYEVTNSQYAEFLNAKDPTGANSLALYNNSMTLSVLGGINFTAGNASGAKYSAKNGRDNNPVVFVSFYDSLRFANWLHNGEGIGDTEIGAYTLSSGSAVTRNGGATWFLPSENEWYKAAYYQPAAQGGDADNYWSYPTQTNSEPNSDQPPGALSIQSNVANFYRLDLIVNGYNEGFAVTGSTTFISSQNYLTDVGAFAQSKSFYGTLDQGGNVYEWNEASLLAERGLRGGSWDSGAPSVVGNLSSSFRGSFDPSFEVGNVGFRVAGIVPEPSTLVLAVLGLVGALVSLRRRTR